MFDLKVAKQNGAVVELLEHGRGLKAWFLYFHFNFSRNMWILELWWKRTQESACKHGAHIVLETTMKISHKWWCRCYHIRRQRYLCMKSSPLHQCLHIYASRKESSLHIYIYIYMLSMLCLQKLKTKRWRAWHGCYPSFGCLVITLSSWNLEAN